MSDASTNQGSASSPYPLNRVVGIVDQPGTLETVVTGLADAGVPADSVEVICGAQAKRQLDAFRTEHGLKARLVHIAQSLSDERAIADRYEHALDAEEFLVVAPASDPEQGQAVGEAMKEKGAHFVNYYGPTTITQIAP